VPGDKRSGPPATEGPPRSGTATSTAILPETEDQRAWRLTRHRLADEHRRLRHARLAHAAMPLLPVYQAWRGMDPTPPGPDCCPRVCPYCRQAVPA
jgi:hypothetical protein